MTSAAVQELAEQSAEIKAIEATAPKTVAELRKEFEDAKKATDAAKDRYDLFVSGGGPDSDATASDDRPSVEIDLWNAYRAAQRAEAKAIYAWSTARDAAYAALKAQRDPNDKDECCDGSSCLG